MSSKTSHRRRQNRRSSALRKAGVEFGGRPAALDELLAATDAANDAMLDGLESRVETFGYDTEESAQWLIDQHRGGAR